MHLKTILNRVHKQRGFVYGKAEFVQSKQGPEVLEVEVKPAARTQPVCSGCGKKGPGYDRLSVRRFEFVPLWGIAVFFLYAMRRVDCGGCGVTVEKVPWAEGKSPVTKAYMWFLAAWAVDRSPNPTNFDGRVGSPGAR
jgi:transposase